MIGYHTWQTASMATIYSITLPHGEEHTMDVTANNYLLPLAGESWEISPVRAARMAIWFRFEPSPVFDSLNSVEFWVYVFGDMTCKQLIAYHKAMGIQIQSDKLKRLLVARLVGWWMIRIQEISKGKS